MRREKGNAFTLIELLVVIFIIALLIGILIPVLSAAKERANRVKCSANLRAIGQAEFAYAADNVGKYPRVRAAGWGSVCFTGHWENNPFNGGQPTNDVTAGIFLLVRLNLLNLDVFLCPSSNQVRDNLHDRNPLQCSNFSDSQPFGWSLSYSFANQYPEDGSLFPDGAHYKHSPTNPPDMAIAADRNDGLDRLRTLNPDAPQSEMEFMNSRNHKGKGQNVLFNDGHVAWCTTPFVGKNRDHIFTRAIDPLKVPTSPAHRYDTILCPLFPYK
jgi:prepilin-type N-terminal cleavage/methylation domain-containing protein/prepilin-type processing-associated H-X9-DG protein